MKDSFSPIVVTSTCADKSTRSLGAVRLRCLGDHLFYRPIRLICKILKKVNRDGMIIAIVPLHQEKTERSPIMSEMLFLATLFLIGTTLLARVTVPKIEQVRLAIVAGYGANGTGTKRNSLAQRR